jgi:hypothetical protein
MTVRKASIDHCRKHSEKQWHIHISLMHPAQSVFWELHIHDNTSIVPYVREVFVRIRLLVSIGMLPAMGLIGAGCLDPI